MQVSKDGRSWRIGAAADVEWIAGHTTAGISITTAIPPIFDAYATLRSSDETRQRRACSTDGRMLHGFAPVVSPDAGFVLLILASGR